MRRYNWREKSGKDGGGWCAWCGGEGGWGSTFGELVDINEGWINPVNCGVSELGYAVGFEAMGAGAGVEV